MRKRFLRVALGLLGAAITWMSLTLVSTAQDWPSSQTLPKYRFRSGEETLRAFEPISAATRHSIVKLNVNGATVALGAVVDTNGLVLTKASEIKKGKLTCWLATEEEVNADLLSSDEEEDVALVQVHASGLTPLRWAPGDVSIGQWAITPGIAETPHAVGIISALPRRIKPQRAFMGVRLDYAESPPVVSALLPGLSAEKAGVKPGDAILSLNDTAVTNSNQLIAIVSEFRAGQTVKLRLRRAKEEFDAQILLMPPSTTGTNQFFDPEASLARLGGEISHRSGGFEMAIEHDTVLPPWLCGGPLVNLQGEAIGLNIARAGRVTTYALSADLVKQLVEHLQASRNATSAPAQP
jgi:serine protease Do